MPDSDPDFPAPRPSPHERRAPDERERQAQIRAVTKPQTIAFFELPRELRDLVYHWLWRLLWPCIREEFPRSDFILDLRYEGHYHVSTVTGYTENNTGMSSQFPVAMLASKQFLSEALEQYLSKTEWFCCGHVYEQNQSDVWRLARLGMTYKTPNKLTAYAGNLSYQEEPPWSQGSWHKREFERIAVALRQLPKEDSEAQIQLLRVAGHSYLLPHNGPFRQAPHIIGNLWKVFQGIKIPRFEVEIHQRRGLRRQLYNVTGRADGEELQWEMVEDWQRSNTELQGRHGGMRNVLKG